LKILNEEMNWGLTAFPSCTSILNRVQKSGYSTYVEPSSEDYPESYALIVDESMMIGSEKLLLSPGVPSAKKEALSLKIDEVRVLDMEVKKSWNSETAREEFDKVETGWALHPPV
jgi:hypothetical protein